MEKPTTKPALTATKKQARQRMHVLNLECQFTAVRQYPVHQLRVSQI